MKRFLTIIVCVGLLLASVSPIGAYYTNMSASVVIGQQDFTSVTANQGGSATASTINVALGFVVVNSKLILSDEINNRVLIWNKIPTTNNAAADVVIGQPDFTSVLINQNGSTLVAAANTLRNPDGIATDGTKLFVADRNNHRVLIYNSIPTSNNASADVVIGQTTMSGVSLGTTQTTLNAPSGLFYDSATGKFLIFDNNNSRILIYNQVPTSNGAAADVVIGQQDFTHGSSNQGLGSPTASTIAGGGGPNYGPPFVYQGKLIFADRLNNRVLIWNSLPTTNNVAADIVLGQPSFIVNSANQGLSVGANTMSAPRSVFVDQKGRLYVAEAGNSRVLIFNSLPTANNASADLVIGQPNLTSGSINQGGSAAANTLNFTWSAFATDSQLFVNDSSNQRILIYNNIISTPSMNINSPVDLHNGKFRINGNVQLGERPNYSLQHVFVNINGQGEGDVTFKDGGRDNGGNLTLYEFYHDVEGWAGSNGLQSDWVANPGGMFANPGFTASFRASSYNVDEDKVFYFTPFSLDSLKQTTTTDTNPSITFTVNKSQRNEMKNNLKYYQVWVKKTGLDPITKKEYDFVNYIDNIPVDFDSVKSTSDNLLNYKYFSSLPNTDGTYETKDLSINYSNTSSKITVKSKTNSLAPNSYLVQIKAINTVSREQQSNNLNLTVAKRTIPQTNFVPTQTPTSQLNQIVEPTLIPNPAPTSTPQIAPTPQPKTCFLFWCW